MKNSLDDCSDGPCIYARSGFGFGASPVLGKGGGNNQQAALKEQQKSREQSQSQFRQQLSLMNKQLSLAQQSANVELPTYTPAPPPSPQSMTSMDTVEAGRDQVRANKRRFGFGSTSLAGNTGNSLGGMSMLGSNSTLA